MDSARVTAGIVSTLLAVTAPAPPSATAAPTAATKRVSIPHLEVDRRSDTPAISADGRIIAFASEADSLVEGDNNLDRDVFVRDLATRTTTRVSVASDGTQADNDSAPFGGIAVSADGRYVVFESFATTLVPDDTNLRTDVFIHDRETGTTTRVSVDDFGFQRTADSAHPSVSADGRYVAYATGPALFTTGAHDTGDVVVHDRLTGDNQVVSVSSDGTPAIGGGGNPKLSGDGRFVAYMSRAPNLVPDDTNGVSDVFAHELATARTERVSVTSSGAQAETTSWFPDMNYDGRFVTFSTASVLTAGDTNGNFDVFVHDRQTGSTILASVAPDGTAAAGSSADIRISSDGSKVSFVSTAENVVAGDGNGSTDLFIRDMAFGTTVLASVAHDGGQGNGESSAPHTMSPDGRLLAFSSSSSNLVAGDTNGTDDVFLRDVASATTSRASLRSDSEGNGATFAPAVSADGRHVGMASDASNLSPNDGAGRETDVFVADRLADSGVRSVSAGGLGDSTSPSVSGDGRYVAFISVSANLVPDDRNGRADVFVFDRQSGITTRVTGVTGLGEANGHSSDPVISADGRYVGFVSEAGNLVPGDTNQTTDVFVHDRVTRTTTRVSVKGGGGQAIGASTQPAISSDGRRVAFTSSAYNLVKGDTNGTTDVFVRDLSTSTTTRVSLSDSDSQAVAPSDSPSISGDGTKVAFRSNASLVAGDTNGVGDVFVRDTAAGTTIRVSVSGGGAQVDKASSSPAISADGTAVAFVSKAADLVPADTNAVADVFLRRSDGTTERVSVTHAGSQANAGSNAPAINADGTVVAFASKATNLVAGDTNGVADVFVRTR